MTTSVRVKRGTRAQIEAAKAANQLRQGEPYLITDEGRLAVGTGADAYVAAATKDEQVADTNSLNMMIWMGF